MPDDRATDLESFSVLFDRGRSGRRIGTAVAKDGHGGSDMKSHYLKSRISKVLFAVLFLVGVSAVAGTSVQAQWPYGQDPYRRDRDRDYRRDRDRDDRYRRNGQYGQSGNYNQLAFNHGYQDGIYTGSNDGQRGQSYNPQRSHFYRNG